MHKDCYETSLKYEVGEPDIATTDSVYGSQVIDLYTHMIYTSIFVKSKSSYWGDVTNLCIDEYHMSDSTSISTCSYNYIERTSTYRRKYDDCFTEINHCSGVHVDYL